LTQYRRVTDRQTDRQTDGQNCYSYSAAFAMPALRRAVKTGALGINQGH